MRAECGLIALTGGRPLAPPGRSNVGVGLGEGDWQGSLRRAASTPRYERGGMASGAPKVDLTVSCVHPRLDFVANDLADHAAAQTLGLILNNLLGRAPRRS